LLQPLEMISSSNIGLSISLRGDTGYVVGGVYGSPTRGPKAKVAPHIPLLTYPVSLQLCILKCQSVQIGGFGGEGKGAQARHNQARSECTQSLGMYHLFRLFALASGGYGVCHVVMWGSSNGPPDTHLICAISPLSSRKVRARTNYPLVRMHMHSGVTGVPDDGFTCGSE